MIISGCDKNDIISAKYRSVETSHAAEVVNALNVAEIKYSAKYDDKKLVIVYSSEDTAVVTEILNKATNDEANLIERLRVDNNNYTEYSALLPEVAELMGVSTSSLQNRPFELRLYLTQAYVDNWFCDKLTIQRELERVTELGYYAQKEIAEAEKNTKQENKYEVQKSKNEEQLFDNVASENRDTLHQQRETAKAEETRTSFFTVEKLRREARRIKNSVSVNSTQEHELTETEDIMVRKK